MTFPVIIIGLFVGGIFVLISLIFGIISLANGKNNNAIGWAIGLITALALSVFSGIMLAHHIKDTIVDNIEQAEKFSSLEAEANTLDGEFKKIQRQEWLDTLQMHINDKYDGNVPPDFYINKKAEVAADKSITVPFLYPYLIRYNPLTYTGDLILPTSDSIFVKNVSELAFDSNFVLIKIDNTQSPEALKEGHPETEYVLFDQRTRNFEPAPNKAKLDDFANRIGYTGSTELNNLSDDYKGWTE
ncbi:MAG: hypothetical protein JWP12_320 [Bacteroidetes bacterium]|nr:hypothetical protein [Bacteroidota bacterium]